MKESSDRGCTYAAAAKQAGRLDGEAMQRRSPQLHRQQASRTCMQATIPNPWAIRLEELFYELVVDVQDFFLQ